METIQTENLKVGDCIKNYKELCGVLRQPIYSGYQKRKQMEEFKRYFSFDKVGVKFYIKEIYDTPLQKERKYHPNAIYVKYIEFILLHYLSTQPNNEVIIPSQNLWFQLGMINNNFITMQYNKERLLELSDDMTVQQINDFYRRCKSKLYKIISDSFESLRKRRLVISHKIYMVKTVNSDDFRVASVDETKIILSTEREILDEFGFDSINKVFEKNLEKSFYSKRNSILLEKINVTAAYEYWHIIHDQKNTINAISSTELQLKKLMLNDVVMKSINKQAVTRYNKYGKTNDIIEELRDIDMLECKELEEQFDFYKNYINMQVLLSDKLLKLENTGENAN